MIGLSVRGNSVHRCGGRREKIPSRCTNIKGEFAGWEAIPEIGGLSQLVGKPCDKH